MSEMGQQASIKQRTEVSMNATPATYLKLTTRVMWAALRLTVSDCVGLSPRRADDTAESLRPRCVGLLLLFFETPIYSEKRAISISFCYELLVTRFFQPLKTVMPVLLH